MTEKERRECRQAFEKALSGAKLADGKLVFTKAFSNGDRKATVLFTAEAWAKMTMLVQNFDKEVAWHGVCERGPDESKDEYIIRDIVVYPQEVTGASVEMDTEQYAIWLMENADDERFNALRMQGHSHVNMGTTPSSVDLMHQESILDMLGDDDFYIFQIWNKSFTNNTKIYDMKKNVLFESNDVVIRIDGGSEDLESFLASAKEMVRSRGFSTIAKTVPPPPKKPAKSTALEDRPKTRAVWAANDQYGAFGSYYSDYNYYGGGWDY
jgi:hypothetical protein